MKIAVYLGAFYFLLLKDSGLVTREASSVSGYSFVSKQVCRFEVALIHPDDIQFHT